MAAFNMFGYPSLSRRSGREPGRQLRLSDIKAPASSRWDRFEESDRAAENLVFMLSAAFQTDAPCSGAGGFCPRVDSLQVFLGRRFDREERLMRATGYPGIEAHIAEHRTILELVDNFHRTFRCGYYDPAIFLDGLETWIVGHINRHDKPFGRFQARHQPPRDNAAEKPHRVAAS